MLKTKSSQQKRLHNEFERYRNSINILSRNSKANYSQNFFQEHKQNILKTWIGIRSIIHISTTKNRSINCTNIKNVEEADPFVIIFSLKKFLKNILKKKKKKKQNLTLSTHLKTTQIILQTYQRKLFS